MVMTLEHTDAFEAVVICTRNRPEELEETLDSIAAHPPSTNLLLAVMDASDAETKAQVQSVVENFDVVPSVHWSYTDPPSLARQRNAALDRLPTAVEVVHFIDDDVTVHPGYFEALSAVLRTRPDVGGAGGLVLEPSKDAPSARNERLQSFFFLSHTEDGRVLPSGCTTSAQQPTRHDTSGLCDTEWLNGCSSYRRSILDQHRFDEVLTGYSMLEDLDLSYRIHRQARLVVQPEARLTHRRSPSNRFGAERYNHALTVHRRWFIEKHFGDVTSRLAYWWSLVGRLLATTVSSDPPRPAARRGLLHGLQTVLTRNHPLLSD
ncbi:glycosyltransferase family 2 protein [Salinibacter pepae]|jgi:GT2 family glycosyltransferase|uniref:glycosyltransferase family 2 protein n=2 Tax=Salinibacter TaxID=146918 RepID=UPI001ABAD8F8|nr:glycosyltransferase family 2 protein [Salinibacter pepae]